MTAWSHGPSSNDIRYLGGDGFDTITLVFTPWQLEAILANAFDRGTLQNYLDGDVGGPFGDDTLSLGATSWNATALDFEDASLALASGPDGFVRYDAIGDNLPDLQPSPATRMKPWSERATTPFPRAAQTSWSAAAATT